MQYLLMIVSIVLADQLVKYIVVQEMLKGQSIPILEGVFHITRVHNTGAAFSFLQGKQTLLIGFTAAILLVGLVYLLRHARRRDRKRFLMTALAFLLGGGVGNLLDRIFRGFVVDYLDFRVFPVFNLADIFVCCGCVMICLYILFLDGKTKKKKHGR